MFSILGRTTATVAASLFFSTISPTPSYSDNWDPSVNFTEPIIQYLDNYSSISKGITPQIQPGEEAEALAYYRRIGEALKFDFLNSSMDTLISHLGYSEPRVIGGKVVFKGLTASDIEDIPSFSLMPRNVAEFSSLADLVEDPVAFRALLSVSDFQQQAVLVSRFFAPKIATYYNPVGGGLEGDPIDPDGIVPGWRKLIRIRPRAGSQADSDGQIKHVYILFNYKREDPNVDPFFGNESGNNQIIIVPKNSESPDRVYFGVYASKTLNYEIGLFLAADFDLPGHVGISLPGAPDSQYYVPRACSECHGHSSNGLSGRPVDPETLEPTDDFSKGVYRFAKTNYLDTDKWYDWRDFDYRGVSGSLNDVVFDGGRDHSSAAYSRAFGVIRSLNQDILEETIAAEVDPKNPGFQTLAAKKWLDLHNTSDFRKPYSTRSIGATSWDVSNNDEMKLLRLLNNHCFRCHSSIIYNVFDREAVKSRKNVIKAFLSARVPDGQGGFLPGNFMPQGRVLSENDKNEFIRLLNTVFPD